MNPPAPGYRTTEFWTTIFTQLLAFLGVLRVIPTTDVPTLQDAVTQCVLAATLFISNAWVVVRYIQSRTALKQLA